MHKQALAPAQSFSHDCHLLSETVKSKEAFKIRLTLMSLGEKNIMLQHIAEIIHN